MMIIVICSVPSLAQETGWNDEKDPIWNQIFGMFHGMKMTFPVPNQELKSALTCFREAEDFEQFNIKMSDIETYHLVFGENDSNQIGIYFLPSYEIITDRKNYKSNLLPPFFCRYDLNLNSVVEIIPSK